MPYKTKQVQNMLTKAELEMWEQIARGELPLEYARQEAARFHEEMRKRFPEKFDDYEPGE